MFFFTLWIYPCDFKTKRQFAPIPSSSSNCVKFCTKGQKCPCDFAPFVMSICDFTPDLELDIYIVMLTKMITFGQIYLAQLDIHISNKPSRGFSFCSWAHRSHTASHLTYISSNDASAEHRGPWHHISSRDSLEHLPGALQVPDFRVHVNQAVHTKPFAPPALTAL